MIVSTSSPRLGFGCSTLGGSVSARLGRKALEYAWTEGVRVFDTARSYGYGSSERILGDFLHSSRSEAYVVTKFGITPPERQFLFSLVKPLGRFVRQHLPGMQKRAKAMAGAAFVRPEITARLARDSVHISLRELRTDYVDLFLVHAGGLPVLANVELRQALEQMRAAGTIRNYGICLGENELEEFGQNSSTPMWVPDMSMNILDPAQSLVAKWDRFCLLHSVLQRGAVPAAIAHRALTEPDWAKQAAREIDTSPSAPDFPARYALAALANAVPKSVLVCTMMKPSHIRANVSALRTINAMAR